MKRSKNTSENGLPSTPMNSSKESKNCSLVVATSSTSKEIKKRQLIQFEMGCSYRSLGVELRELSAIWEFESDNALRSIMPPAIMTLLLLRIYSWLRKVTFLGGCEIQVVS